MKYTKKLPATDSDLINMLISTGWKRVNEPSNLTTTILFSIPFIIINAVISMVITYYIYPPLKDFLDNDNFSITLNINFKTFIYIAIIILFMILHEFIHTCLIPNFLKSDRTYWGINGLFGFVFTTEQIGRGRHILISLLPFISLSIILPLILGFLGLLNGFILFLCLLNAMGSSVDCLNALIILNQVPKGSYIVNNGFETYYKINE